MDPFIPADQVRSRGSALPDPVGEVVSGREQEEIATGLMSGHRVKAIQKEEAAAVLQTGGCAYFIAEGSVPTAVVGKEMQDWRITSVHRAQSKMDGIVREMDEDRAHALWTGGKGSWSLISNKSHDRHFSSASFFWPTDQLKNAIEVALSWNIPGLDLSYKQFFDRLKEEVPDTEIIITGGLVRDIVCRVANGVGVEPIDVDIQVTLKNRRDVLGIEYSGKTIEGFVRDVLLDLAKRHLGQKASWNEVEDFVRNHYVESEKGYVGMGDCGQGVFLDIFDASIFALNKKDRCDFTVNTLYYRYSEFEPFLFAKSRMGLVDAINGQLRLAYNPFDALDACLIKPSDICRFLYFRSQKGFKLPLDGGLTMYALSYALNDLIRNSTSNDEELKRSKNGGQYYLQMERIRSGMRLVRGGADHGDITFEKDIARVADKFFRKKFNDAHRSMAALRSLKDDFIGGTQEFLLFAELVKQLLNDVDKQGEFKEASEQIVEEIRREVREAGGNLQLYLSHEIPLSDVFGVMTEVIADLPEGKKWQLQHDLNDLMVDSPEGFNCSILKGKLEQYSRDDELDPGVRDKVEYIMLCLDVLMDGTHPRTTKYEAQTRV